MIRFISVIIGLITSVFATAQISGNRVYGGTNGSNYYNPQARESGPNNSILVEKDSVLYINASVLLNTKADHYLIVLGASQTSESADEALNKLNGRISNFVKSLGGLGINSENIYIDFITQTKVFDYRVSASSETTVAAQREIGMQTKKNINISINNIQMLDVILLRAAANGIYDIIKVDYVIDDPAAIHRRMLNEADAIVNEKKRDYLRLSSLQLLPFYNVNTDDFTAKYPATKYQTYTAFESGTVSSNYYNERNFLKKDLVMDKTFFYEGENISDFDKVINNGAPFIGVQFILKYSVKYYLKKR